MSNKMAETTFATNLGNTTLAEAGLLNSSSSGTMLSRVTLKQLGRSIVIWMRELLLNISNAVMPTKTKQAFAVQV
jgi:hypothetical protein